MTLLSLFLTHNHPRARSINPLPFGRPILLDVVFFFVAGVAGSPSLSSSRRFLLCVRYSSPSQEWLGQGVWLETRIMMLLHHLAGRCPRLVNIENPQLLACEPYHKELHFPNFPSDYNPGIGRVILVFSPSIYGWAFVLLLHSCREIWFSIEGKGAWNHVSSYPFSIHDIYAFKGKIYALSDQMHCLFELRLIPHPKLTMLEIKKPKYFFYATRFVSSGERLCVRPSISKFLNELHELDFGEMKWVKPCEKTFEEYAFFYSDLNHGADVAVKWESLGRFASFPNTDDDGNITFFTAKMWYFPHQSMDVDRIDE
ncbi:unnamed protein product [Lactuca virosa]|uniref:KIB1-4 beta-propeller domain-containing protein n=1 Tax=Lactuca virosa TaxID=75947 RepID=A0AAU9PC93_9ASTR|nr:unnamed protein product [Lactuca virosa]